MTAPVTSPPRSPLRRRFVLRGALALVAAAAIAALAWWVAGRAGGAALELWWGTRRLIVPHPAWLIALATLPYLWLIESASLADLSRGQRWLSLAVRAGLVAAIVAALTGAAWIGSDVRVCTVAVVDVSDSIPDEALVRARAWVEELRRGAGPDDSFRLVTFAAAARAIPVPADPNVPLPPEAIARHLAPAGTAAPAAPAGGAAPAASPGAETAIQDALRLAYGLFPPGNLKRIALVSDGAETRGAMLAESDLASSFGVHVFTRSFPEAYRHEVAIRAVEIPARVRLRAPFDVRVELFSTDAAVPAKLTAYRDGVLDHTESLTLPAGPSTVHWTSEVFEAGLARWEVSLDLGAGKAPGAHDTFAENNRFVETAIVRGKPQVLIVDSTPAHLAAARSALEAAGMTVDVRGPRGLPESPAELARFDAVILSDVAAHFVSHASMGALEAWVRDGGGGLLLSGGENAYGPGGWLGTKLERIMPVSLDVEKRRDVPSIAIVLVIDKSGSMEGTPLEVAKDAAKAVVEVLERTDSIGVIAFDAEPQELVALTPVSNRTKIMDDIARLNAGGGTAVHPALEKAYDVLRMSSAVVKHVILLSDGQDDKKESIPTLVAHMASAGITVTAVGILDGIDRPLLEAIAAEGGGRFYHATDLYDVPRIFVKEAETVARNALLERPVRARVVKDLSMLAGVPFAAAPDLLGYVATRARPGAELVLDVAETGDPLLATWRVGLGKVAAWTSDVKPRWAFPWLGWSGFGKLFAQIVRDTMRHGTPERFDVAAEVIDGRVHAVVDAIGTDDRFVDGLTSRAKLFDAVDPKRVVEVDLHQTAAGRYEATFTPPGLGSFVLEVTHRAGEEIVGVSRTPVSLPYPRETLTLAGDRERLVKLAARTGGAADAPVAAIWAAGGAEITTREPVWPFVALAALGMFVLDVALRRVRLWDRRRFAAGAAARGGG